MGPSMIIDGDSIIEFTIYFNDLMGSFRAVYRELDVGGFRRSGSRGEPLTFKRLCDSSGDPKLRRT